MSGSTIRNSGNIIIKPSGHIGMCMLDSIKLSPVFRSKRGSKLTMDNTLFATIGEVLDVNNNAKVLNQPLGCSTNTDRRT